MFAFVQIIPRLSLTPLTMPKKADSKPPPNVLRKNRASSWKGSGDNEDFPLAYLGVWEKHALFGQVIV